MTLVLIEVPNEAAVAVLRRQPDVRVVGIVAPAAEAAEVPPPHKPSIAHLEGSLSDKTAERMRNETNQLRNEWEREF